MRIWVWLTIALTIGLGGCTHKGDRKLLSRTEALGFGLKLANEKGVYQYGFEPFTTEQARLDSTPELWLWTARARQGKTELAARVQFGLDGSHPRVVVEMFAPPVVEPRLTPPPKGDAGPLPGQPAEIMQR